MQVFEIPKCGTGIVGEEIKDTLVHCYIVLSRIATTCVCLFWLSPKMKVLWTIFERMFLFVKRVIVLYLFGQDTVECKISPGIYSVSLSNVSLIIIIFFFFLESRQCKYGHTLTLYNYRSASYTGWSRNGAHGRCHGIACSTGIPNSLFF